MPHRLSRESNGVLVTLHGVVTGDEVYGLNEQLMSDELFSQRRYQIWDFSDVERLEASFDHLRNFAIQDSIVARKNPDQRIAIIPRRSPRSGLDRVFHILEDVWGAYESKTFLDVDAAREWATGDQE
jgi:hypothetical protein